MCVSWQCVRLQLALYLRPSYTQQPTLWTIESGVCFVVTRLCQCGLWVKQSLHKCQVEWVKFKFHVYLLITEVSYFIWSQQLDLNLTFCCWHLLGYVNNLHKVSCIFFWNLHNLTLYNDTYAKYAYCLESQLADVIGKVCVLKTEDYRYQHSMTYNDLFFL